jgi:sialic acid synthase SpsE
MLFEECQKAGIEFLASVFDCERILWLEEVGVKRYKIASRSVHDNLLIGRLSQLKKPLIVSLGMWDKEEFPEIHTQAPVDFLFCVNQYPSELKELHLGSVDFRKYAGLSDHTIGISASLCAFSRGARILEKHFTLDKKAYGPDHAGSMTPDELRQINQFRKELDILL